MSDGPFIEKQNTTVIAGVNTDEGEKGLSPTELIGKMIADKNQIQRNRMYFERQWLVNIAFLFGRHHFRIEKRDLDNMQERIEWELVRIQSRKKIRRTANYILPLYRSVLSRLLQLKTNISVTAGTNQRRDRDSARVAKYVLDDHWENVNKSNPLLMQDLGGMILILSRLFKYQLAIGHGYIKPVFNPNAKGKAVLGEEGIVEGEIGAVETQVPNPFKVFPDILGRFIFEEQVLGVDDIEEQYDKKVEPEKINFVDVESRLTTMLQNTRPETFENAARIWQRWSLPSKRQPDGQLLVFTQNKMLHDGPIPEEYKGRMPYIRIDFLDLLFGDYAQGIVEQLIPLQEDYNFTITRIAEAKKWMTGKVMAPKQAKLTAKWDDEMGQLLFYQAPHKPEYLPPPTIPSYYLNDLVRIRRDMEDIAMSHDASIGRVPAQIKSGVAIDALKEQDVKQMAPVLLGTEAKLSHYAEMVLDIIQIKYTVPRLLSVSNDQTIQEVRTFKGKDVEGERKTKIDLGSSLPDSKEARQAFILNLVERGLITPDRGRDLLEIGDVEGVYHNLDEANQKSETENMINDDTIEIVIMPFDNHVDHLRSMDKFFKSQEFEKLDKEIRDILLQHRQGHQEALAEETKAANALAGSQPPAGSPVQQ